MDVSEAADEALSASAPAPRKLSPAIVVGVILGLVVALFAARLRFRDPTPPLTSDAFAAARRTWKENAPANYDLEVIVNSRMSGKYRVEVRENEPLRAFRNDAPLTQSRTFHTWTVPGMFDTMSSDVDALTPATNSRDVKLTLRAELSPLNGAPLKYRRIEWGSDFDTEWEITVFDFIESDGSKRSLLSPANVKSR